MFMRWEKWIDVEFFHDYYRRVDGTRLRLGADLEVSPTADCARLMAGHQIQFRRAEGGFSLLYRTEGGASLSPLVPLDAGAKLSFHLFASDPQLACYSELPLDAGEGLCVLDNLDDNRRLDPDTNRNEKLLTADASRFLSGADFMPLRPPVFGFAFASAAPSAAFQIKDGLGEVVREETLLPAGAGFETVVDLSRREEGVYTIWMDGARVERFYAGADAARLRPFGVVELYAAAAVPADYRFLDGESNPVASVYTVRLKNRETVWKYFVGLKYKKDLVPEDLRIVFPDAVVAFTRRASQTRMGDMTVVPFDSGAGRLPLRKVPVAGIKLMQDVSGGGAARELAVLPNPAPANLKEAGGTVYSEIFIYV